MTLPRRHTRFIALLAALALPAAPARAGLPVFDALNWVESALTKVESWVQTAQAIAQGDWAGAALYGSSSMTSAESLIRVRTTLGRGLSARNRIERAYRNVNRLRDMRENIALNGQALYGGAADLNMWAIGETWEWGERQNRSKLDEIWDRVLTKGRSTVDRATQRARDRLARALRDDPCGDGTLGCAEGERVQQLLRAKLVRELGAAQRKLCEDSAELAGLDRDAAAADDTDTPEAGSGDPGEESEPGSDDPAPGSTDGATSTEAEKRANFELSRAGQQAQALRLQQRQEQARISDVRGAILREDCESLISDGEMAELDARIRQLEAALGRAHAARATMTAMVVTRARMHCQGRSMANMHLLAYGTVAAGEGGAEEEDYGDCAQARLDAIWSAAVATWSANEANAGLTPPDKPSLAAGGNGNGGN